MSSSDDEGGAPKIKKNRVFFGSLEDKERQRLADEEIKKAQGGGESSDDSNSDSEGGKGGGIVIKIEKKVKQDDDEDDDDDDGDDDDDDDNDKEEKEVAIEEKMDEIDAKEVTPKEPESAIDRAILKGNINLEDVSDIPIDDNDERNTELLAELEKKKKAKAILVSTDDATVKSKLRDLGHPICLFGEGPMQRRDRLRELLSVFEQLIPGFAKTQVPEEESSDEDEKPPVTEVWYHQGPQELKEARQFIAEYSLPRTRDRLEKERRALLQSDQTRSVQTQEIHRKSRAMVNFCSQIGDTRPLTSCCFSPNEKLLAVTSWSGVCRLWSIPSGEPYRMLKGHTDRPGCIAFHPRATLDLSPKVVNMVSCGSDGAVFLWDMENETPLGNIEGHDQRVSSVAYHPSGRFIATACFDRSWRLWDMEQCTEVLHQEGHSKEVYKVAFQQDGALAASCGLDARGLIWDLRTGRNVVELDGHLKRVLAIDFSPDGYTVATGSEDQKVMVWDLRKRACVYTIPAHSNIVSCVKFTQGSLLTCSYDGFAKIWSQPSWAPLNTLAGHEQKVTCIDVTKDGQYMVTTSFDRTFKLWGPEYAV